MDSARKEGQNNKIPPPVPMDLAERIKGMYRLLDLISESGSNGCGNEALSSYAIVIHKLNLVISS